MIPRSLRARVTVVGVVTLAIILSVGSWLTVRALAAALRGDIQAQNLEVLDRLAEEIELGVDPRVLPVPVGADGTDFLILNDEGVPLNASFIPVSAFAVGDTMVTDVMPGELQPSGGLVIGGEFVGEVGQIVFTSEDELLQFLLAPDVFVSQVPADASSDRLSDLAAEWYETRRTIDTPSGEELTLVALSPFAVISRSIDRLVVALLIIVP
ncbi:MAG: hypothetical protein ACI8TP_001338 [Acidimicrobiales bacterium]|jgi:hypothetical protein